MGLKVKPFVKIVSVNTKKTYFQFVKRNLPYAKVVHLTHFNARTSDRLSRCAVKSCIFAMCFKDYKR